MGNNNNEVRELDIGRLKKRLPGRLNWATDDFDSKGLMILGSFVFGVFAFGVCAAITHIVIPFLVLFPILTFCLLAEYNLRKQLSKIGGVRNYRANKKILESIEREVYVYNAKVRACNAISDEAVKQAILIQLSLDQEKLLGHIDRIEKLMSRQEQLAILNKELTVLSKLKSFGEVEANLLSAELVQEVESINERVECATKVSDNMEVQKI